MITFVCCDVIEVSCCVLLYCTEICGFRVYVQIVILTCCYLLFFIQKVHQWKIRCAHATAQNWWKQLLRMTDPSFQRVREMISATPFGPLIDMDWGRNDASLGFALVERWWDTTHTFHFPWGEAGITPLDFTMLTGMGVGEGVVLPFDMSLESLEVAELYFPSDEVPNHMRLQQGDFSSGGIRGHGLLSATSDS
jgi:hypothetical protein